MPGTLTPSIVEEIAVAVPGVDPREAVRIDRKPAPMLWRLDRVLLGLAVIFFALHFVHLRADFPNNSPWKDWAKYTDEGWYGDAAIRHYQLGHWNVPGDFNPAAALPVWPALELVLFRFTGVSMVAARALSVASFGLTLVACYRLLRMWGERRGRLAPGVAALMLLASSFCFVFTRLAILEPLLVFLTVMALIAATRAGRAQCEFGAAGWIPDRKAGLWSAGLGALLVLSLLTKTTALFLFPAVGWLLWAACGMQLWAFARAAWSAGLTAALLWGGYYGLFVRPHFREDYTYLFTANRYTGFQWDTLGQLLLDTVNDAVWIGPPLFTLALVAMAWAFLRVVRRGPKRDPLLITLMLWVLGYGAFLTYHANLQPRYYLVVAVPMTMLVALAFESTVSWLRSRGVLGMVGVALATVAVGYAAGWSAWRTVDYVRNPEYTWLSAARQVQAIVNQEAKAGHPRLLLSISGSELSLMTGVPAICDDFGVSTLEARVAKYKPGWFATWNDVEDDKMQALAPYYRLQRVATIPAFDDPERNLLILYRLDPRATKGEVTRGRKRRPVWVPRSLRTPVPQKREAKPAGDTGAAQ
jgi:4-amino-4-deoxy-L-arabinose transferase-like glycosyltransferase